MTVKVTHIGIYTDDLERLRAFYEKYFGAVSGAKYMNDRGFSSYFLTLGGEVRLELMTHTQLEQREIRDKVVGFAHIAFSTGSREAVIGLTERLTADGIRLKSPPRETGDGYFESCIFDPDGNSVEITI